MQKYEAFLYLVNKAHRRVRMDRYLSTCDPDRFVILPLELQHGFMVQMDELYNTWCNSWNDGLDEPTLISNLFVSYVRRLWISQ